MTDVQKRLVVLLDEIDGICREKSLCYMLADETAISAMNGHHFSGAEYDLKIIMPLSDIPAFLDAASQKPDRETESWSDNEWMNTYVFRYVDSSTLLIDYSSWDYFTKPGVAVTIIPLLPKLGTKLLAGLRYISAVNVYGGGKEAEKLITRESFSQAIHHGSEPMLSGTWKAGVTSRIHGKAALAEKINREILSLRPQRSECRWVIPVTGVPIEVSTKKRSVYDLIRMISFEKKKRPIPREGYFSYRYGFRSKELADRFDLISVPGEEYLVKEKDREVMAQRTAQRNPLPAPVKLPDSKRVRVIADVGMPYRDFLEFTADDGKDPIAMKEKRKSYMIWKRLFHDPMKQVTDHTFNLAKRSRDRIDIWYSLRDRREELRKAMKDDDVSKLRRILSKYLKCTDTYFADGIGMYIDDEIFECAKRVWKDDPDRPEDFYRQVYELVPDIYRNETPDEYFKKRRAEGKMI